MISLDWKERLKLDTVDFVARKIPQGDFDIDIVYNAYPKRVDNKIPSEVITFVAKNLAVKIGRNLDKYYCFYDYLWEKKGENGKVIFAYLMKKALKRKPTVFLDYLRKVLSSSDNYSDINTVLNKALLPLMKIESKKYIDIVFEWLNINNPELHKAVINLFIKIVKHDTSLLKYVFRKLERQWLYPNPHTIKDSISFLKASSKIDPAFYYSVYGDYKGSRNPVFVEILCNALNPVDDSSEAEKITEYLLTWQKSGNIRIKKAAVSALKSFKKR